MKKIVSYRPDEEFLETRETWPEFLSRITWNTLQHLKPSKQKKATAHEKRVSKRTAAEQQSQILRFYTRFTQLSEKLLENHLAGTSGKGARELGMLSFGGSLAYDLSQDLSLQTALTSSFYFAAGFVKATLDSLSRFALNIASQKFAGLPGYETPAQIRATNTAFQHRFEQAHELLVSGAIAYSNPLVAFSGELGAQAASLFGTSFTIPGIGEVDPRAVGFQLGTYTGKHLTSTHDTSTKSSKPLTPIEVLADPAKTYEGLLDGTIIVINSSKWRRNPILCFADNPDICLPLSDFFNTDWSGITIPHQVPNITQFRIMHSSYDEIKHNWKKTHPGLRADESAAVQFYASGHDTLINKPSYALINGLLRGDKSTFDLLTRHPIALTEVVKLAILTLIGIGNCPKVPGEYFRVTNACKSHNGLGSRSCIKGTEDVSTAISGTVPRPGPILSHYEGDTWITISGAPHKVLHYDYEFLPSMNFKIDSSRTIPFESITSRVTTVTIDTHSDTIRVALNLFERSESKPFSNAVFLVHSETEPSRPGYIRNFQSFQKIVRGFTNPFYALYLFYNPYYTQLKLLDLFDKEVARWDPTPANLSLFHVRNACSPGAHAAKACAFFSSKRTIPDTIRLMKVHELPRET
jgi:hypothetical protein